MWAQRRRMVDAHIAGRGLDDSMLLDAMLTVPRHEFVPEHLGQYAYEDRPLPIGAGQTISQPYMVAMMVDAAALTPSSRVLEIGAGSGYGAAVLSRVAGEVWSIERHQPLATAAQRRLDDLGYANAHVIHGDGTIGLAQFAPYDAIVVTAAAPDLPRGLLDHLVDGGRLIIPIGPRSGPQQLHRIRRVGTRFEDEELGGVMFVPLVGDGQSSDHQ